MLKRPMQSLKKLSAMEIGRNFFKTLPSLLLVSAGWSNFCTPVSHFSKLFEFAGLSRLKTPIFVPKSGCSLQKKKKGLHLESVCKIPIFVPKSGCSLKKKKVLESVSKISIFAQNHSVLQKKITAACDRKDLCKIVGCGPRARSWTTLS